MDNIQMPPFSYSAFRYVRLPSFLTSRDTLTANSNPPPQAEPELDMGPSDAPDPTTMHSLWAAQYNGSNKYMVVGIDLGLAALLAIFLYVVWRQWRKGKRARAAADVEAAKEEAKREGVLMAPGAERLGEGWEKEQVVITTTCVAVPEEVHKKVKDRK